MLASTLLCLVVGISDGDTLTARCGQPETYEQGGAHRCHRRTGAHTAIQARQPYDVAEQKSACSVIQSQFAIATGEICVKGHG